MELTDEQKEYMEKVGCWGCAGGLWQGRQWGGTGQFGWECRPCMLLCCGGRRRPAAADLARAMAFTFSHPFTALLLQFNAEKAERAGTAGEGEGKEGRTSVFHGKAETDYQGGQLGLAWLAVAAGCCGSGPRIQAQPGWRGRCCLGSCAASHALLTLRTHLPALVLPAGRSWLECPKERSKREVGSAGGALPAHALQSLPAVLHFRQLHSSLHASGMAANQYLLPLHPHRRTHASCPSATSTPGAGTPRASTRYGAAGCLAVSLQLTCGCLCNAARPAACCGRG